MKRILFAIVIIRQLIIQYFYVLMFDLNHINRVDDEADLYCAVT